MARFAFARTLGCFSVLLSASAACKSETPGGGSTNGGGGGNAGAVTGGTSSGGSSSGAGGTSGAASGAGPSGGAAGAGSGGTSSSGAAGSTSTGGAAGDSGAGTGGGSGTSGASGASGSGGSSGDPCAAAIFCDDFDDGTLNAAPATPWTVQNGGSANAVIDGTHAVSGDKAVKFSVPSGPGRTYIALRNAPVFPITANAFYGRAMFWLEAAPTASVHWTIIEASGLVPSETYHSAYRLGGQHPIMNGGMFAGSQLMANYETPDSYSGNGPRSDCWHHADRVVLPTGRFSCVEWHYDGPNNAITMWLDDTEVISVRGAGVQSRGDGCGNGQPADFPWTAPTFDTVRFGWESYQTDGARTLWLDDVVISSSRVGCP